MAVKEYSDWTKLAICVGVPADRLFVSGAEQRKVRTLCFSCPVRLKCLVDSLNREEDFGIWGGLTERERRALLKAYPHVNDWGQWVIGSDDNVAKQLRVNRVPTILSALRKSA